MEVEVTTGDGVTPVAPVPAASASGPHAIHVHWEPASSGATPVKYKLYRSESDDKGFVQVGQTIDAMETGNDFLDTGLSASTRYYYRLAAFDSDGDVAFSDTDCSTALMPDSRPFVMLANPRDCLPRGTVAGSSDLAIIQEDMPIRGTVDDCNNDLVSWSVVLRSVSGIASTFTLASGTSEMGTEGSPMVDLGTLQPSLIPDGVYQMVLVASDSVGPTETSSVTIQVKALKTGNFTLPVDDLELEGPSGTITVRRVYDSSLSNTIGDFGYGWRLDLSNANIQVTTSNVPMAERPPLRRNDLVVLDIPGVGRQTFMFMPKPTNYASGSLANAYDVYFLYKPQFVAVDGGFSRLEVTGLEEGTNLRRNGEQFVFDGILESGELSENAGLYFNPATAALNLKYKLTALQGTVYTIDPSTGEVESAVDANGNVVHYDNGNVSLKQDKHSQTVRVSRDGQNRVSEVHIEYDGKASPGVHFTYDADSNLESVLDDRTGETTTYSYGGAADHPHLLTNVQDSRCVDVIQVTYDSAARVVSVSNASGQSVPITTSGFSGSQGHGIATDPARNTVEYVYNDHGDVVREIKQLRNADFEVLGYQVTVHQYNYGDGSGVDPIKYGVTSLNHLLGQTDWQPFTIAGEDNESYRYTRQPDQRAKETTYYGFVSDPEYQNSWQLESETTWSAADNVEMTTTYGNYKFGKPGKITDPYGGTTINEYDAHGNLIKSMNALGEMTKFTYTENVAGLPNGLLLKTIRLKADGTDDVVVSTNDYYPETVDSPDRGRLKSTTDAAGVSTFYEGYNDQGRATRVYRRWTNAAGHVVVVTMSASLYDAAGREIYTESADGKVCRTTYGPGGLVLYTENEFGGLTVNTYDVLGRLIRTVNPDGTETRHVYDSMGREAWSSDAFAGSSVYSLDDSGNLTWTDQGNAGTCVISHNVYDSLGRVVRTERYSGGRIKIDEDKVVGHGQWTSSVDVSSASMLSATSTIYDGHGRVVESVDASGLRSGTIYYDNGQVKAAGILKNDAAHPDDPAKTAPVDWYDQTNSLQYFESYSSYVYERRDSLPAEAIVYDVVTDASSLVTRTYRDALGRTVRTEMDDGSTVIFTETLYSVNAQPIVRADLTAPTVAEGWAGIPAGGRETVQIAQRQAGEQPLATYYVYDASGRLTDVWLPAVDDAMTASPELVRPHWHYEYDKVGNQTAQVDPRGNRTTFIYDNLGHRTDRMLPAVNGNVATESWTYDKFGRMATHVDFNGQTTQYFYDDRPFAGGLLSSEARYGLAMFAGPGESTGYDYDPMGRQSSVDEVAGESLRHTSYQYDPYGWGLTQVDSPEGVVNHQYDAGTGRLIRTWTTSNETWYDYDVQGRLWHVTQTKLNDQTVELVTTYTYDVVGNLDTVTAPNGVTSDYDYDGFHRLDLLTVTDSGGQRLFEQDYRIESDGQRDFVIERRYDGTFNTPVSVVKIDWEYDADGRLIQEVRDSDPTPASGTADFETQEPGDYTDTYAMDLAGNRLVKTHDATGTADDETVTSTYDERDRLVGTVSTLVGSTTYEYDGNGNTAKVTAGGVTKKYVWDLRNRMVGFDANGDGDMTDAGDATYVYDIDGNRVSKTVVGQGSVYYLLDGANPTGYSKPIEEKASLSGSPTRSYVLGMDVVAQADVGGSAVYLLRDGHGSTRALTDDSGSVVSATQYDYDAFGNATNFMASLAGTTWLGPDGMYDAQTGLTIQGVRYTDRTIGRFISADTWPGNTNDPISLHKYLYAGDNPVMCSDPTGMFTQRYGYLAEAAIQWSYRTDPIHAGDNVLYGKWTRLPGAFRLKPDILNLSKRNWLEIKPFTPSGVLDALESYGKYMATLGVLRILPDATWQPSSGYGYAGSLFRFRNVGGIVFYTDNQDLMEDMCALVSIGALKALVDSGFFRQMAVTIAELVGKQVPRIVGARITADTGRLENHLGIAGLLAVIGGVAI